MTNGSGLPSLNTCSVNTGKVGLSTEQMMARSSGNCCVGLLTASTYSVSAHTPKPHAQTNNRKIRASAGKGESNPTGGGPAAPPSKYGGHQETLSPVAEG